MFQLERWLLLDFIFDGRLKVMGKSLGDNRRQTFGSSGFLSKRVICRVNGVDDESGLELIFARCPLCTFVRSEN